LRAFTRGRFSRRRFSRGTFLQGAFLQGGVLQGGVSPGGVSSGGVSPGGVSPGGVSPGGVSPGGVSRLVWGAVLKAFTRVRFSAGLGSGHHGGSCRGLQTSRSCMGVGVTSRIPGAAVGGAEVWAGKDIALDVFSNLDTIHNVSLISGKSWKEN
jgi:hypothetical protein